MSFHFPRFISDMRLDIFLKLSRLISRRSLAQNFCDAGLISVNSVVAKSSKEVKPGDTIEIRRRNKVTKIQVETAPAKKQVSKEESATLFRVISEVILEEI